MSILTSAIVLITSALVCYTIAVWSQWLAGHLRGWHVVFFWLGLVFDASGTYLMVRMAGGGLVLNLHTVTGAAAFVLMAIQTLWATRVWLGRDESGLARFRRASLLVWALWLIPFSTGAFLAMGG